jgi:hypothetical protein
MPLLPYTCAPALPRQALNRPAVTEAASPKGPHDDHRMIHGGSSRVDLHVAHPARSCNISWAA